jgi:hypothetical protein
MSKKQTTTVLMAAVLAVATVLAAGLTLLPGSVQEAQANPCALEADRGGDVTQDNDDDERECNFIGNFEDAFESEED